MRRITYVLIYVCTRRHGILVLSFPTRVAILRSRTTLLNRD